MKKFFAVLLAVVMILGCVSALAEGEKIALVTDVGTIDDESFNQACWQAVEAFAIENDVEYTYYQPNADSLDARLMSIDQAVTEGASVIVMPGYLFGATLVTAQDKYPDVKFIAVDVSAGDLTVDYTNYVEPAANVVCVTFSEEQAGFLAGYAAVKDGYTKLGFLGGMAVPAVIRYGYGFVQGADKATPRSRPRWKAGTPPAPKSCSPAAAASTPPLLKLPTSTTARSSVLTLTSTTSIPAS